MLELFTMSQYDPAGERAGDFFDILLGVVFAAVGAVLAHREEFEQLATVIFVRLSLLVDEAVEVDQHRRVEADVVDHRAEVAEGVPPQQLVIVVGEVADRVRSFARVGGPLGDEVMVPEERHLLDEPFAAHRFEPRPRRRSRTGRSGP